MKGLFLFFFVIYAVYSENINTKHGHEPTDLSQVGKYLIYFVI